MKVHFLGSGDGFGSDGRLRTCFCVQESDGRLRRLVEKRRASVDPNAIRAVVISAPCLQVGRRGENTLAASGLSTVGSQDDASRDRDPLGLVPTPRLAPARAFAQRLRALALNVGSLRCRNPSGVGGRPDSGRQREKVLMTLIGSPTLQV
jgi:hypothetical protein